MLTLLVLGSMLTMARADAVNIEEDRIQPYSRNPSYWQYKGRPILLLGGSESAELFQWTGTRLTDHLELLRSVGGNYVRNIVAAKGSHSVSPFRKVGKSYDLDQWNSKFWARLDTFLRETRKRDIFVQIELWDGWNFRGPQWDASPWNPKNNVNYTVVKTGLPISWWAEPYKQDSPFALTVPRLNNVQIVLRYQERFVRRILEVCLRYNHVLFTIHNESRAPHEWSNYWAHFLHQQAAMLGRKVEVSDMRGEWDLTKSAHRYVIARPEIYTFVEVSQNNHLAGQLH